MSKRKICVVTGTRAEYGLLFWTMKALLDNDAVEFQLIVTGMHLSPEFGMTVNQIEKDGFPISKRIEILLSSDTPIGISKSIGLATISFSEAYSELNPDLILLLGDRFEIFAASSAALIANIPVAHCHGGETTEGAFDEALRHAITKMSHIHFVSTESYKKRVIQLGEPPERVFNVGALGIENINRLNLLSKAELEKEIGFKFDKPTLLVTYHPVTLEKDSAAAQFRELLDVFDSNNEVNVIVTKPNADTEGRALISMIDEWVSKNKGRAIAFTSMGQLRYLSAMQYVIGVVGNSSSGILEAPSFKIGTIDIGDRQKGRIRADSVINCTPDQRSIAEALETLMSEEFQSIVKEVSNPYDAGNSSDKILETLHSVALDGIQKKKFFDLP